MKLWKILLATGGVSALLALAGAASANRLSLSSASKDELFSSVEFSGGFGTVRCSLTLEGSFHSKTFTKTPNLLLGYIARASIGPCPAGSATVLTTTLPWHLRYKSFVGTLPDPSGIKRLVVGLALQIQEPTFGITCLATSTATEPAEETLNRETRTGTITSVTLGGSIETTCGVRGTLSGTSSSYTAGGTTRVTLTLI